MKLSLFTEITKRDEEQRMVFGYASTGALDSQGEQITVDAMSRALGDYMQFANIREMHQPSAVGVAKQASMDEKGLYIGAKVVDDEAWAKVVEGVYKGFSIGGRVLARDPSDKSIITDLQLTEISLVDRPANPEALIEVWKFHNPGDEMNVNDQEKQPEAKPASDSVKKGFYEVSSLADLTQQLLWLASCCEDEAEWEADKSPIPDKLKTIAGQLCDVLVEMAQEETEEAAQAFALPVDDLKAASAKLGKKSSKAAADADASKNDGEDDVEEAEKSAKAAAAGAEVVEKAGAAISAANMSKIQAMHDHAMELGATCGTAEKSAGSEDLAKAASDAADALAKAEKAHAEELAKFADEIKGMSESLEKMAGRIKELEAEPAPAKGATKSVPVSKSDDVRGEVAKVDEPTDFKSAMKAVWAGGGRPLV